VARRLGCNFEGKDPVYLTIRAIERELIRKSFAQTVQGPPESQVQDLEAELRAIGDRHRKDYRALGASSVAVASGNAAGFGTYLMASTIAGVITNAVGVSLPFAFYTSMSSTLAVLLGPIGITFLGAWGLHKLSEVNFKKTVESTLLIAWIRVRLENEHEERVDRLYSEIRSAEDELSRLTPASNRASMARG
jgi:hypothetical protein